MALNNNIIPLAVLRVRQFIGNSNCNNGNFDNCSCGEFDNNCTCNCNGNWGNWGRWVLLAAIIIFFLLVAVAFACINSRRRRRRGLAPRYGTGWVGKTPFGHNAPQYNNYNQGNEGVAPPYSAPPPVYGQHTGNTFNSNDGYYGQQTGIELQQPQHVYQPPAGPPPGAKN